MVQNMKLKPALTFEKQISRLEIEHGLIIDDRCEALDILSRVNYYRLSAYGIGLKRRDDPEKYVDGISLSHLYHLYEFDSHLRSALLHLLEQVEIELRTQIAYCLGLAYGSEGYMDPECFTHRLNRDGSEIHQVIISKFRDEVRRQANQPCVKHHQKNYDGHFPVWVAVELFSFGMLSSLYSIMKSEDQKCVAGFYNIDSHRLGKWMQSLVDVRNRCAHYGRIYNMPLSRTPALFSEYAAYQSNRIFPVLLILKRLMQGKPSWITFLETIKALMDEYTEVRLDRIGFPEEWQTLLEA